MLFRIFEKNFKFLKIPDGSNRRSVDKTTRNFLITSSAEIDALTSDVLARYLLSSPTFSLGRGALSPSAVVKIVEKILGLALKFHGFACPNVVVAIMYASSNYREASHFILETPAWDIFNLPIIRGRRERREKRTRGKTRARVDERGYVGRGIEEIPSFSHFFQHSLRLSFLDHVRDETARGPLVIKETEF